VRLTQVNHLCGWIRFSSQKRIECSANLNQTRIIADRCFIVGLNESLMPVPVVLRTRKTRGRGNRHTLHRLEGQDNMLSLGRKHRTERTALATKSLQLPSREHVRILITFVQGALTFTLDTHRHAALLPRKPQRRTIRASNTKVARLVEQLGSWGWRAGLSKRLRVRLPMSCGSMP
jgi:hypothetical protein